MNQDVDGLESEVALLLDASGPAVVLERVARGAGMTRWWLIRTTGDFRAVYHAVRPGSRVSVLYGTFPATDGEPPSIRFTPPDADGVVRPQPV